MIFAVMQPLQAQIQARQAARARGDDGKRFPLLPDLPTIAEIGLSRLRGARVERRAGRRRTRRKPIIARLNAEMNAILKEPDVLQKMHGFGFDLIGGTPEDFGALISGEAANWAPVIKKVGLKVD